MKASKRILCAILCVLLITASGCGNGGHGTQKTADNGKRPVMGRYVEEEYSLEDAAGEKPNQIKAIEKLADGNIRMIIEEKGIFESQDQGKTWQQVETPWWEEQDVYKRQAALQPQQLDR